MYFKRLEIFGFKSFGEKATLNFEPGITAIVGPNGCGKSNVFDSIRWVLGEQSVKELRGSSMEDVIFNGTDKKPALGFAEVNLTFSNASRMLPVDQDEIIISRRLFRSGESEYLVNKETVRLKDVQEMLMGTGIGAEAYSLVQQGKVDLVVSARPEDRRMIFDEAAGITKYKSKKREALNKLKDTENNLLRVNDIVIEVKRQIASIERQANKARRYKEEYEKLKQMKVKLAKRQIESFVFNKDEIKGLLNGLKEQESQLHARMEELNTGLSNESDLLAELEQNIHDVQAEDVRLGNQIDMDMRQIGFNEERIQTLKAGEERLNAQKIQLHERCRVQQAKIEEVKKDLSNIKTVLEEKSQALADKKTDLQSIADAIKEAKVAIRQDEDKILELSSQQVHIKNDLTEVMKELQGALARKRRLDIEFTKVSSEKEEVDQKLQSVQSQIARTQSTVSDLQAQRGSAADILNEFRTKLSAVEEAIAELEKKRFFLKSQKEFIEELRVQYQDMPDPAVEGRLRTKATPQEHHTGIIGKVTGVSPVAAQDGNDSGMYEILCETKFIELDPQQVTLRIETLSREIEGRLQQKDEITGDIQRQQGVLNDLDEGIRSQERSLSVCEAQQKDILDEAQKISGELELVETEISEVKEQLTSSKRKEEELSLKFDSSEKELQWCRGNIRQQQDIIAGKSQEREGATVTIAQVETEIESITDKARTFNENFEMFSETFNASLGEISKIEADATEHQQKHDRILQDIEGLKNSIASLKEKKESLNGDLAGNAAKKNEVAQKINSLKAGIASVDKEIETAKETLHTEAMKEQELAFSEKGIKDRLSQTYKIDYDQAVAEMDAQSRELREQQPDAPLSPEMTDEELTFDLERLKKRCDSFGSVNLVAIEECEELKQRFEFLTKQQEDLVAAKDSLHQTINKINRTTRQLFMETFTKVGEAFRIYFRMLFGGGEAQLVLMDPDNVLESGIEIVARPPGKKLQNISLLSGGEKTMTAIALIFGVFKVRPSPFCVLDEIDAALDESNVGRFGYLLQDFAKIAQFIVVTHNKKTIANANVMYGITMQETGVSKVVSVKLAENEKGQAKQEVPVAV